MVKVYWLEQFSFHLKSFMKNEILDYFNHFLAVASSFFEHYKAVFDNYS
jgi:hypothetical protein